MIPILSVHMSPEAASEVAKVLGCGYIGEGPRVVEFESKIGAFIGVDPDHILALNSCTSALRLALHLSDVGPGDEVISTPMTCIPTNSTILEAKANVVWADIDPLTGRIDPEDVARKVTKRTRAIMCMDWGGTPCDLAPLKAIAEQGGAKLIVDAAHSFGATYRGRAQSAHADFVCYSFQAVKHVTSGDGGALACASREDRERGRLLRWFGVDRNSTAKDEDLRCSENVTEAGFKFHMNDISATIGICNLKDAPSTIGRHVENAAFYDHALSGIPGLRIVAVPQDRVSVHWLYTIIFDQGQRFRDAMLVGLKKRGIMTSKIHARNDMHSCFRESLVPLSGVDRFYSQELCIPVGHWVSDSDREKIVSDIRSLMSLL